MAGFNGQISWGIQPSSSSTNSNLAGAFWKNRYNYLKSVNDPLRYQIQWFNGNVLTEGVEPSALNWTGTHGDVVNVVFKIYTSTNDAGFPASWDLIGTIKKSRDIINSKKISSWGNSSSYQPPRGHRFTIDVSQLVADELSYSLCPINKGTWQNNQFGGMNGGLTMQDNVLDDAAAMGHPVSKYNVSANGTFRLLRIQAGYEVINGDGEIVSAGGSLTSDAIAVINSVNQFEKDSLYYKNTYCMSNSDVNKYRFLSRCPNWTDSGTLTYDFMKPVREDEQAEYLQFYMRRGNSSTINASGSDTVGAIGLYVETFLADGTAENDFYIRDFEDNLLTGVDGNGKATIKDYQNAMFVQNVSPYYINNTAALKNPSNFVLTTFPYWTTYTGGKITASTAYYRVSMFRFGMYVNYTGRRTSKFRYYTIDREDEKSAYGFVRFHWLNSLGGIDSYTAKRDVVEGLTISRDVVERKSGDRTWYQDDTGGNGTLYDWQYYSDTMRGGDIYKGGREVTNVNAERVQSVYTEPLNKSVAKWLEEMILSPNVWIEMATDATHIGHYMNPYLRPSDTEYIPVIITNSDVETVNQAEGLVKFNIEYTLAHKVITQRN